MRSLRLRDAILGPSCCASPCAAQGDSLDPFLTWHPPPAWFLVQNLRALREDKCEPTVADVLDCMHPDVALHAMATCTEPAQVRNPRGVIQAHVRAAFRLQTILTPQEIHRRNLLIVANQPTEMRSCDWLMKSCNCRHGAQCRFIHLSANLYLPRVDSFWLPGTFDPLHRLDVGTMSGVIREIEDDRATGKRDDWLIEGPEGIKKRRGYKRQQGYQRD